MEIALTVAGAEGPPLLLPRAAVRAGEAQSHRAGRLAIQAVTFPERYNRRLAGMEESTDSPVSHQPASEADGEADAEADAGRPCGHRRARLLRNFLAPASASTPAVR
jgi:hypothetical protein